MTAVKRWRSEDGTWLTTRLQYDDAGNVLSSTDPQGSATSFSYADSWGDQTCLPSGGNGAAYVTSVTNALGQTSHATYNSCTGSVASTTDANNQPSTFTYDMFGRPTQKNAPDGGQTSISYDDTGRTVTTSVKLNAGGTTLSSKSAYDGLGRTTQTKVTSDPVGDDYTDTVYDALGRVYSVSNSYRTTSDSTYGLTTYQYDALGRPVKVTDPDGNTASSSYSGNCVTVADEQGKDRKTCTNGLGQLTQVFENPSGKNLETDYIYDVLGDLTSVVEAGGRPRTFAYDSLGRLTQTQNPESGTVNYVYDSDANCASPNSSVGDLISKTDNRGIRTCMQYDALHRVTQKNYSDGTNSTFIYDQSNPWGWGATLTNPIGRLVADWNSPGVARVYNYDSMGRINLEWECEPSCSTIGAQYDLAGDLTQLTYPDGRVVTQGYDAAANLTQVQFASMNGTQVGYNYFSSPSYAANGAPLSWTLGNGVTETQSYNTRWQPVNHVVANASATLLSRTYGFNDASNHDDGNVMKITDNLSSGRTLSFGYDALSRVTSAATQATSGADCGGGSSIRTMIGAI